MWIHAPHVNAAVRISTITPVVHLNTLTALQATREKLEAASAAALPAPPAQGRLEFIADRVKQRRYFCVVIPAVHFNVGYFVLCMSPGSITWHELMSW